MFDLVRDILALAKEEGDRADAAGDTMSARERCGLIVRDGQSNKPTLIECENTSVEPSKFFRIEPEELHEIEEKYTPLAIWHTHPNEDAGASQGDLVLVENYGLPCHIVSWPQAGHSYTEPTGYVAPYEGRVFVHGLLDCYTIIRDWYQRERGVTLENFDRKDCWWRAEDGSPPQNLYVDNFASQGFVEIEGDTRDFQVGDVVLMQIDAAVPNHGAIYLGDGMILHHPHGRLSSKAVLGGFWLKHYAVHLRHGGKDGNAG